MTLAGKIMTIVYALYGVPVFMWYIIKLGALFRVVVMAMVSSIYDLFIFVRNYRQRQLQPNLLFRQELRNVISTVARPVNIGIQIHVVLNLQSRTYTKQLFLIHFRRHSTRHDQFCRRVGKRQEVSPKCDRHDRTVISPRGFSFHFPYGEHHIF